MADGLVGSFSIDVRLRLTTSHRILMKSRLYNGVWNIAVWLPFIFPFFGMDRSNRMDLDRTLDRKMRAKVRQPVLIPRPRSVCFAFLTFIPVLKFEPLIT